MKTNLAMMGRYRSNITTICNNLGIGYRNPKPKRVKSVITFRGTTEEWLRLRKVAQ
jgi:hypothetical protein